MKRTPLSPVSDIILDATYLKVRVDSCVCSCAVLIAVGICRQSGKRIVLGVSAALSEAEVHWREFLSSLKQRGCGVLDSITSDAHEGIKVATDIRRIFNAPDRHSSQILLEELAIQYEKTVLDSAHGCWEISRKALPFSIFRNLSARSFVLPI